ncbi:MAG: response regulator [Gammaproteobacteria bacterium]|nr:response regulator [Gammaproteobacteria bacterium]MBU1601104.1 response regulator [Gammaproteobacteria bacterium]MBU2434463.1 response regulator [Gammaproteobacteria bacterium]MBU2450867.1 response regulator [Gammaproteobacteria bacterium]
MNLRKAFFSVLLALSGVLTLIAGATLGALSAYDDAQSAVRHRQDSMALMGSVRHEVDLLSRLVSSYVSTANPRYLIYYYDILAIREGTKKAPDAVPETYWEQVIGGSIAYVPPPPGTGVALAERTNMLGFDQREIAILRKVFLISDQMKQVEQVAFAATQGLYDPVKREFVSEAEPQRDFANALLHEAHYLKLRAELAIAVDELARQVAQRTTQNLELAGEHLLRWIIAALLLLLGAGVVMVFSYGYLKRHLLAPLTALHRTATALSEKSFSERVGDLKGVEEVQALAATIDSMAAAIEADIAQRELVQRSLRQARARAEVAAEAKSIFLANMSHEIRTPMNAILGMAYLALKSGLPPRQHDYVSKIHTAARSLLGILNDVLDFSKIEAGKVELEAVPFDLELVAQNALFMVQQRAEGRDIELIADFQPARNLHHLVGDPLRLGQVLINLLSNAVKFTEKGHVRLVVSERSSDRLTSTFVCRVEDTGIGMTQEQVGRLFQEFSQADGSTTRRYGGSGLGLAISKRLLAAMGSEIRVESEVDRGTAFHFAMQLPLESSVEDADDAPPLIECQRALVVDDYPPARESMAAMLKAMGCAVVDQSQGGLDALARLTRAGKEGPRYDLLLLDWLMPDLSGGELIEALRSRGLSLPDRTLVVSVADASLLRQEVDHAGVAEVVQKPLLPNVLRHIYGSGKAIEPATRLEHLIPHPGCLQGMSILLVEDNELNQQVAGEILRGWGASVDVAENGKIALDTLSTEGADHYSLVLMDLEMPIMDGREATRRLREDETFQDLPIIAMTAHVAGQGMKDGLAMGVNGYIAKPFEPEELLAMVQPYWRGMAGQPFPPAGAADADRAFIAAITAVPQVDSAMLLRRFAGRLPFLARTLQRFAEDTRGWCERLDAALTQGDLEGAQRQVHSLKGLAGTFAMGRLQSALYDLESVIKGGVVEPFGEIAEVDAQLQALLAGLDRIPAVSPESASVADERPIEVVLAVLRDQLGGGDGEAEEVWRMNKGRLVGRYSPRQVAAIDHAIGQWDFDQALHILDSANSGGGGQ